MGLCFVIQPFDNGEFDQRYEDIFVPAIKEAGLEPYRVDKDPKVTIIIGEIETKIKNSALCLADISLPNPNVWYEVGYAAASNKDIVLVCSDEVNKFPFDIQHKKIIKYSKASPTGFKDFQENITKHIIALINNEKRMEAFASELPIQKTSGLSQCEIAVLVSLMQNNASFEAIYIMQIHNDLERAGFNKLGANLALVSLKRKEMIEIIPEHSNSFGEPSFVYGLTTKGETWLLNNMEQLKIRYDIVKELDDVLSELPF